MAFSSLCLQTWKRRKSIELAEVKSKMSVRTFEQINEHPGFAVRQSYNFPVGSAALFLMLGGDEALEQLLLSPGIFAV